MTDVIDTQDLFGLAAALPEQIEQAVRSAAHLENLPARERVENIVVLGVGGSGIAGDVLAATAAPFIPVPITVIKGYELPAFVGEGSLVFAVSYSGETEETIEAATEAAVQGAKMVVVSSGGQLSELAGSWGAAAVRVPKSFSEARAAIGPLSIAPLAVLEDIGLFPGAAQWIELAVAQLKQRRDSLNGEHNLALELAEQLIGKAVVVAGGGAVGSTAAQRWKTQINNNAKSLAFASEQPESGHNEINGWSTLESWTKDKVAMVSLRHDDEHPQVSRRFDLTDAYISKSLAVNATVQAEGDGNLAQLFDLVMLGDYVSLHMAVLEGVDPGPTPYIEELKAALSERAR